MREWALSRYGAVCMRCRSTNSIEVDHIKSRSRHHRLRLRKSNVQILCKPCNQSKGSIDSTDYRPIGARMRDWIRKFMIGVIILIVISLVFRFLWIDYARNGCEFSVTCQVWDESLNILDWIIDRISDAAAAYPFFSSE